MMPENKFLQIQGIVDNDVLRTLINIEKYAMQNTLWLFVDYSPVEYKLKAKFDIILAGEKKSMMPKIYNIKLLDVIEQTGKKLRSIPVGYKTICRFEFKPLPDTIQELPILKWWAPICQLKFAHHEDIVIDSPNVSRDVYTEVINDFISFSINTPSINKRKAIDFLDTVSQIIHANSLEMKNKITNPNLVEEFKKRELHIG